MEIKTSNHRHPLIFPPFISRHRRNRISQWHHHNHPILVKQFLPISTKLDSGCCGCGNFFFGSLCSILFVTLSSFTGARNAIIRCCRLEAESLLTRARFSRGRYQQSEMRCQAVVSLQQSRRNLIAHRFFYRPLFHPIHRPTALQSENNILSLRFEVPLRT